MQWEEEVILGLKGTNIVSLKTSMSASQTDHLGHCVALNQLWRQKGNQEKVIKLVNWELFQELLSNEPYQREKSVCIVFQDIEKGGHKLYFTINKYPFNGKCTSSFLSNYCPVLKHFPMAMIPRRRNMPKMQEVVEIHWVQYLFLSSWQEILTLGMCLLVI